MKRRGVEEMVERRGGEDEEVERKRKGWKGRGKGGEEERVERRKEGEEERV